MCTTCGCGHDGVHEHHPLDGHEEGHAHARDHGSARELRTIHLKEDLLAHNTRLASATRHALMRLQIGMFNLIGGPGAGKTALLEATIPRLRGEIPIAVLEGDQATARDTERIRRTSCPVLQINTGPGCHLDAAMVGDALKALSPPQASIVFVENVGNLVCPAVWDLGEAAKVAILSVTEGEDKPLKYPDMFAASQLMILNKTDLLPHVKFDVARCIDLARRVNPAIEVIQLSATTGEGMDAWLHWLDHAVHTH